MSAPECGYFTLKGLFESTEVGLYEVCNYSPQQSLCCQFGETEKEEQHRNLAMLC